MVKPYKIFFLLLLIIILISLPSFFFPNEGVRLFNFTLHYPKIHQVLGIDTSQKQNPLIVKPEIVLLDKIIDSTLNTDQLLNRNELLLKPIDSIGVKDTTKVADASNREQFTTQNPLFGLLSPRVNQQGQPLPSCMVGLASSKDTARVDALLKMNQVKALFPRDLKFLWSQNPYKYDPTKTLYELHAIKITTRDGRPPLDGGVITSARTSSGVKIGRAHV